MYLRAGIDSLNRMSNVRSAVPGFAIAIAVLIFVPTTGDYVTPALVGGADGVMISSMIQVQFARTNNWPLGAALAVVSITATLFLPDYTNQDISQEEAYGPPAVSRAPAERPAGN